MRGRETASRAHFQRVHHDDSEVAVFRISGSLGPSTRASLERLVEECHRRMFRGVIFDFSAVESLGVGNARLLRDFANERLSRGLATAYRVSSSTVRGFLTSDSKMPMDPIVSSMGEAMALMKKDPTRTRLPDRPRRQPPALPAERAPSGIAVVQQDWLSRLRIKGLASCLYVFELHPNNQYHLVTRSGVDFERYIPANGSFAQRLLRSRSPQMVIDLLQDSVDDREEEMLAELNCEVVIGFQDPPVGLFVFLAKERASDEYTLEELELTQKILKNCFAEFTQSMHGALNGDLNAPVRTVSAAPPVAAVRSDATRALQRQVNQLQEILRSNHGLDASFGPSRILEVMVLSTVSIAQAETVIYFERCGNEYIMKTHRGLSSSCSPEQRVRMESSIVQAALVETDGLDLLASMYVEEDEKIWARKLGVQFVLPFRRKQETMGLVFFGPRKTGPPPDLEMVAFLLAQAGLAYDRARLYGTLEDRTLGVVRGLMSLIEVRNGFDSGSTEQVVRYAQAIGREMNEDKLQDRDLVYGAVLRDVGMLRISETLLRSSVELSADQWEAIRRHPIEGAHIMRQMRFSHESVEIVLHHHESYNGEGYPMGLRGRAIPLGARIIAVAESYVKMTMDRPYRQALGRAEALESISENWGLCYDPVIVDALIRVVNREMSMGLDGDAELTRDLFGV